MPGSSGSGSGSPFCCWDGSGSSVQQQSSWEGSRPSGYTPNDPYASLVPQPALFGRSKLQMLSELLSAPTSRRGAWSQLAQADALALGRNASGMCVWAWVCAWVCMCTGAGACACVVGIFYTMAAQVWAPTSCLRTQAFKHSRTPLPPSSRRAPPHAVPGTHAPRLMGHCCTFPPPTRRETKAEGAFGQRGFGGLQGAAPALHQPRLHAGLRAPVCAAPPPLLPCRTSTHPPLCILMSALLERTRPRRPPAVPNERKPPAACPGGLGGGPSCLSPTLLLVRRQPAGERMWERGGGL